ncbi:MAG: DUF2478 domain-containing protein [Bradyrhizobium sp.]
MSRLGTLAGVVQHQAFEGADRRCDVILEDLSSGHRTTLFENRGAGARGCRLDEAALAEATARVEGIRRVPANRGCQAHIEQTGSLGRQQA